MSRSAPRKPTWPKLLGRNVGHPLSPPRRRLGFEELENRHLLTTITVNTLIDVNNPNDGLTTLREAVAAAATNDTINFSVTGTINLSSSGGQININKSLTIQGPGANLLTIKAFDPDASGKNDSDGNRVFYVNGSGTLNVIISGLTLTNGDPEATNDNNGGGAILNLENLTLNACVITDNYSPNGGAIYSPSGTLVINDSLISGNSGGDGAGILVDGGSLSLNRTTVANNEAKNSGGGILNRGRPLTIVDSTISGNSAEEHGGGVYLYQGSLVASGSTISGNVADEDNDDTGSGGGIYNMGGSLAITNSTISGNSARENGGGGIFSDTGQAVTIAHSTITANSVNGSGSGGGIRSNDPAQLNHTIVAGNFRGSARDDVAGSFDASFSLVGDRRSATVNNISGSLIGTTGSPINPLLGVLANNGGPTMTHILLNGSPAIDSGNAAAVAGMSGIPQFDQRGTPFSRVVDFDGAGGVRIDIGAVEMRPGPALPGDYNLNNVVDAGDYLMWRKTQGSSVPQYSGADGDGDSMIGSGDYMVWRSHFGQTFPGAATATSADQTSANVAQSALGGASVAAAAFASLAKSNDSETAAKLVLKRGPAASESELAIELLLATEGSYARNLALTVGAMQDGEGISSECNFAVDAALEGDGELVAFALDL